MSKYLVVANQTLGGTALVQLVKQRASEEPTATFHVVVPATAPDELYRRWWVVGSADEIAHGRLSEAVERLTKAGVRATGEVGAADPMQAIRQALAADTYSGLIISTLPAGISRWVRMDLPHRAARDFKIEVDWIEAHTDAADEATTARIEVPADV